MARGVILGTLCLLCCASPLVLMFVSIFLFANPSSPSFSLNQFYVPALNASTKPNDSSTSNMTIHFDLTLQNENAAIGLHYPDPINITFSYFPNVSKIIFLAEYRLNGFYQGNGNSRRIRDMVVTNGMPVVVLDGTDFVAFRVDLAASYRYKKAGTKKHKVLVGCTVEVNYSTGEVMRPGIIYLAEPGSDSQLTEVVPNDY